MCSGQITGAQKKFIYDLAAREAEGILKELCPVFPVKRMMMIEPVLKRAELFLKAFDHICIVNCSGDLEPVSYDAGICKKAAEVFLLIGSDLSDIKAMVCLPEILLLVQNGCPAQACLIDLQDKPSEQFVVVIYRKSVGRIMIDPMHIVLLHSLNGFAVSGRFIHKIFCARC